MSNPDEYDKASGTLYKIIAGLLMVLALLLGISLLSTLFSYEAVARFWPLLVVAIGLIMATGGSKATPAGVLVMLLGVLLVIGKMGWFGTDAGRIVEIFILVLAAIMLLLIAAPKR